MRTTVHISRDLALPAGAVAAALRIRVVRAAGAAHIQWVGSENVNFPEVMPSSHSS
jgi:hypothetical protein